ncbi:PIN domain-containing protein [Streptomyces sp. NPDC048362]|uniref:PIN domain-containing protein n=1 Tax=Streptomyces sp. NPDC048362 TaxID=3365539 RepID=UPI00371567F8
MAFIAVYDANVLYPSTLRDVLIRVAQAGPVQAKWTDQILDETFRNLKEKRPDLDPSKLDRTRELMAGSIRDVLVKGYEPLIDVLELPDRDDCHVLAAAIRAKAQSSSRSTCATFQRTSSLRGAFRLCILTPSLRRRWVCRPSRFTGL